MVFKLILTGIAVSAMVILVNFTTYASPYGAGKYGANVPYGGETSLSLSTSGSVAIPIAPSGGGTLGSTAGTVTVTSSDVVGYKLYVRALTTADMSSGAAVLGASTNISADVLSTNTWGYNLDGSTNFVGMTTTDALLKTANQPYTSGDTTTVTYGVNVDSTKPAGDYTTTVMYTAIPQTD